MCIVMGLDFGTDSVRAIAVETANGRCLAEASANYSRWGQGRYCDPARQCYRQHPLDYIESMTEAVRQAAAQLSAHDRARICALGVDATGSTVCAVDENAVPLALHPEFAEEPLAMFQIWKDLSASEAAGEINAAIGRWKAQTGVDYAALTGSYSAERYWAKALRSVRENAGIRKAAFSWIELADWIPNLLMGCSDAKKLSRCSCAAAHKAMHASRWNGLPDRQFLAQIDPHLASVADGYGKPQPSVVCLGRISPEWAQKLGLPENTVISGSMLDAHAGAVGAGVDENSVAAVLGTSAVYMTIARGSESGSEGLCSMGEDSIIPGWTGLEAGQAAFGDAYAWLVRLLGWGICNIGDEALTPEVRGRIMDKMLASLTAALPPADAPMSLTALDWFNGRRHPYGDDSLLSAVSGLSLGTDAPDLFRGLIFASAFGARRILEGFVSLGAKAEKIIAVGGIAQKSPYIMQVLADVLRRPVYVPVTAQTCALGAAMAASVACGAHGDLFAAQQAMAGEVQAVYRPDLNRSEIYDERYAKYLSLGAFAEQKI